MDWGASSEAIIEDAERHRAALDDANRRVRRILLFNLEERRVIRASARMRLQTVDLMNHLHHIVSNINGSSNVNMRNSHDDDSNDANILMRGTEPPF
jgi:hypothetical protein